MNDDLYAKALDIKMTELMEKDGGYYPFEHSNFREFLEKIDDESVRMLIIYLEIGAFGKLEAGCNLNRDATEYWTRLARIEAEARLAEECPQCWGLGCPACEDKGHDDD